MHARVSSLLQQAAISAVLTISVAQPILMSMQKEKAMTAHALGTFTVKMGAPKPGPAEGLSTFTMEKRFQGSFEGDGKGEMVAGGDYQTGAAGYVAIETLTGTLEGKHGSFALQHSATMKGKSLNMTILVTPGSGTGELKGIDGSFTITIKDGQHFYDLEYTLTPAS